MLRRFCDVIMKKIKTNGNSRFDLLANEIDPMLTHPYSILVYTMLVFMCVLCKCV